MADEHIRAPDQHIRPGASPPGRGLAPDRGPEGEEQPAAPSGVLHEGLMFLRWFAGLVIVLVLGWGLILAGILLARAWRLAIPMEVVGVVFAGVSLAVLIVLERNFWLSRFMGLRIGARSSPLGEAVILWALGIPGLLFRSTAPAGQPAAGKATAQAEAADSLREVGETVVFVIVLVLMLKTFVAEAFVIPTGSMATTLLGYHRNVTCPQCGYTFPVNISDEVDPSSGPPTPVTRCTCPNCHYPIDLPGKQAGTLP
jgi:hypothetical protein